jgi:hypothetical protein
LVSWTVWFSGAANKELKMGSHNLYKPHPQPSVRLFPVNQPLVSTLVNSVLYFLDSAVIIREANDYRLVVLHNKQVLADQGYETLRGAKIAFSKLFQYKAFLNSKAEWSHLYPPEQKWLDDKLRACVNFLPEAAASGLRLRSYVVHNAP